MSVAREYVRPGEVVISIAEAFVFRRGVVDISVSFKRELIIMLWKVLMHGYKEMRTAQGCLVQVSLRWMSPLRTSQEEEFTFSIRVSNVNRSSKPGEKPGPLAITFLVASIS